MKIDEDKDNRVRGEGQKVRRDKGEMGKKGTGIWTGRVFCLLVCL